MTRNNLVRPVVYGLTFVFGLFCATHSWIAYFGSIYIVFFLIPAIVENMLS